MAASDHSWHCIMDGIAYGPVPFQQLREWVTSGHLQKHHRVWRQGDTERQIASRVDGLFDSPSRSSQPAAPPAKPRESSTQHKPVVLEPRKPREQPKPAPIPKPATTPASPAATTAPRPAPLAQLATAPVAQLAPATAQPAGNPRATHDVFISYSSKDKPIGDAICATLEQAKIRCWIAPRDVLPGLSYGESIIDGITVSKVMVVVLSNASNMSPHVLREVERAVSKGIQVIPFRVEDVKPTKSLEFFLSTPHWLDAYTTPLEPHIERLKQVVQAALQPPPPVEEQDTRRTPGRPFSQAVSVQRMARSPWSYLTVFSLVVIVLLGWLLFRGKDTTTPHSVASAPAIQAEFEKYKKGLISGRGSIVFLKEAATERYAHWMDAAKAGDPIAQLFVARCMQEGLVVKQDEKAAIEWLNKSASAGNDYAMHTLGLAYDRGQGVEANLSESLRWYQMAADKGNTASMRSVGGLYSRGIDKQGPQLEKAVSYYRKAADLGDPVAMRWLAQAYESGKGIAKDAKEAERWMDKSAKAGDPFTAGTQLARKMAPLVKQYIASTSGKSDLVPALRKHYDEFLQLDLSGVSAFCGADWRTVTDDLNQLKTDDPVYQMNQDMLSHFIKRYERSTTTEKIFDYEIFATMMENLTEKRFKESKFDEIVVFWENCFKDIPMSSFKTKNESNSVIRLANFSLRSLFKTGKRKEASELLASTLELCDWILKERPWDWYTKDAYSGVCFDAAELLVEMGESAEAQPLLKRAWQVRSRQFGREAIMSRYAELPLKGKSPANATKEDKEFFDSFAPGSDKSKSGIKRFTVPTFFSGKSYPFHVYVMTGPRGYAELQDQFRWVKEIRGGDIAPEVHASFRKLNEIASQNKVDFMELCVYALTEAGKEKEKK